MLARDPRIIADPLTVRVVVQEFIRQHECSDGAEKGPSHERRRESAFRQARVILTISDSQPVL